MDASINSGNAPAAGYNLVVFRSVHAASSWARARATRPLALLLRLRTGRLIEIDLGLKVEGVEISARDATACRVPVPP